MQTVILSQAELFTIAAALQAVSPSGGGSNQYTVARKIAALLHDTTLNGEHLDSRTVEYIHEAHREFESEFA